MISWLLISAVSSAIWGFIVVSAGLGGLGKIFTIQIFLIFGLCGALFLLAQ